MGKQVEENFDFNNPDSVKRLAKEISKEKSIVGVSSIPKDVMAFLTKNMKSVAVFAIYFLGCGLILNIIWIVKLFENYFLITIISLLLIVLIILYKKYNNKIKSMLSKLKFKNK